MKFKLLSLIHTSAVSLLGTGLAAAEAVQHSPALQAALAATGVTPHAMTVAGTAVGFITYLVKERGKDKLAQAIIDDPKSPTPQGLGLPAPGEGN